MGDMPAKKNAPRRGNPPSSDWYSTPNEKRNRPRIEFSLDPETVDRLDRLSKSEDRSKSAVIDDAVKQYDDRSKKK